MKKNSLFLLFISFTLYTCTSPVNKATKGTTFISADHPNFYYSGRIDFSNPKAPRFSYPGITIKARFQGSLCNIKMRNYSHGNMPNGEPKKNYYYIIVDDQAPELVPWDDGKEVHKLRKLNNGIHEVTIFKRTEALVGDGEFLGLEIESGKSLLPLENIPQRKIEFIGNSITCGYGNEGDSKDCPFSPETENNYMAYGAITARALNAQYMAVAYSGKGMYRNYDESTKETMSLIYDRIFPHEPSPKWNFDKWKPDVVVINLGTNDFAKGNPDSTIFCNTYLNFVKRIRNYYPQAHIFCISGPMMSDTWPPGNKAWTTIKNYITACVKKMEVLGDKKVYSYFLTPQGEGDYGCDWHPNVKRHQKMANELTAFIKSKTAW
ncbi:MAG: GDSL-type esterase/lipase family protein [Cytophagaceae bacterium]|nr:GDSL-type esterase/lipase family protein [Cytophagaceae bacterium]MDW8456406.1 SGNH/GDSL hydrolase family protein [Cytophagaceae bacterium]